MAGSWTSICSDEADVLKVAELSLAWQKIQSVSMIRDVGRAQLRFGLHPDLHEQLRVVSVIFPVLPTFLVAANLNDRFGIKGVCNGTGPSS